MIVHHFVERIQQSGDSDDDSRLRIIGKMGSGTSCTDATIKRIIAIRMRKSMKAKMATITTIMEVKSRKKSKC